MEARDEAKQLLNKQRNESASHHIYIQKCLRLRSEKTCKANSLWSADEGTDPERYAFSDFAAKDA